MFINHASKQVTAKIVYYGTGLSGKTTNLQYIFSVTNPRTRGELVSMETDIERTLFFDLLPINVGLIKGYQAKFQLYTVPGQIFYDSTRKLVLKNADGIVFVVDSQELMEDANIESFENLKKNLIDQGQDINKIPLIFQYNKRDLKNIQSKDKLDSIFNPDNSVPSYCATASKGEGVLETLREVSALTLVKINTLIDRTAQIQKPKHKIIDFDTSADKKIVQLKDLPVKKVQNESEIKGLEDSSFNIEIEEDIQPEPAPKPEPVKKSEPEKIKKEPEEKPVHKPKTTTPATKKKNEKLDILDSLGDKTRLTLLKNLKVSDNELQLKIYDSGSNLLDTFNVSIDKKTKKITLILNVKR